jgi:hypothetical protein
MSLRDPKTSPVQSERGLYHVISGHVIEVSATDSRDGATSRHLQTVAIASYTLANIQSVESKHKLPFDLMC